MPRSKEVTAVAASPPRPCVGSKAGTHHGPAPPSSLPLVSSSVTSLRQLHGHLRSCAVHLIEGAGKLLQLEEEARICLATLGQGFGETHGGTSSMSSTHASVPHAIPSTSFLLAAASQLTHLVSTRGHSSGSKSDACDGNATLDAALILAKVLTWYCLESACTTGISLGLHSLSSCGQGTSTAGNSASHTPRRHHGATQHGGNQRETQQWMNRRLSSNTSPAGVDANHHLAEHLIRAAVEFVVRATASLIVETAQTSTCTPSGDNEGAHEAEAKESLQQEVRAMALWLLAAAITRFSGDTLNIAAYIPMLFPEEDPRKSRKANHPLLTPLIWGPVFAVRAAATCAVVTLLNKLQVNLQYAEEPRRKQHSFVSLASQGGALLSNLHECLFWVLKMSYAGDGSTQGRSRERDCSSNTVASPVPPIVSTRVQLFSVYSTVVVVTPYRRCPHCLSLVQETLRLPILRLLLEDGSCSEYVPLVGFLTQLFQNESLRSSASEVFLNTTDVNLMDKLLLHAVERPEVWRCFVQLSRLFPSLIHERFDALVDASVLVMTTLQELAAVTDKTDATLDNSVSPTRHSDAPSSADVTEGALLHRRGTDTATAKQRPLDESGRIGTARSAICAAFSECLRAWIHFMGYVWKAFDGISNDPALRQEVGRATDTQKTIIYERVLLPAMTLANMEDVQCMLLRCLAQMGDGFTMSLGVEGRGRMLEYVTHSLQDRCSGVRADALTTMGVWVWQYPSMDSHSALFLDSAVRAVTTDSNAGVRSKAAFMLSNLTSRLIETTCDMCLSPESLQTLCDTAVYAVMMDGDVPVQSHGIRMINHLLQVLTFEDLIGELSQQQEGVAEGFLSVLIHFLSSSHRDPKHRWNAAVALGMGLSREVVFEAEPVFAIKGVEALTRAVSQDRIFKVRSQAATALGKVPVGCLVAGRFSETDHVPLIVRALCSAFEGARSTEDFAQYREQGALQESLRCTLQRLIVTAPSSSGIEAVFAQYKPLLQKEGLL